MQLSVIIHYIYRTDRFEEASVYLNKYEHGSCGMKSLLKQVIDIASVGLVYFWFMLKFFFEVTNAF